MSHLLNSGVAIVTGAGGGLGAATARAIAAAGCSVALWDLKRDAIDAVATEIADGDQSRALPQVVDVAETDSVDRAVAEVLYRFGRIDYLINCAGLDYTLPITELSVEQWDRVLGVNLRGPFLATRAVFPIMRQQNGGHVINVASTAAVRAWPNASAYCASKWGLVGFTRAIGTEGRDHNIRATVVIPGGMRTGFFDRPDLPIKPDPANLQDPDNVARAIVFALSQPPESVIQEIFVTPARETSWP
ncbi:MAG TPA: SDR family oxidoreductase [Chloroflexota bacterium]|nr:SDR family oxidoreductase [Chloroflexota bacterium]